MSAGCKDCGGLGTYTDPQCLARACDHLNYPVEVVVREVTTSAGKRLVEDVTRGKVMDCPTRRCLCEALRRRLRDAERAERAEQSRTRG